MAPKFDIRHGEKVRLLEDVVRDNVLLARSGMVGKVLGMRGRRENGEACCSYLVKWQGMSCPVSVERSQIERV